MKVLIVVAIALSIFSATLFAQKETPTPLPAGGKAAAPSANDIAKAAADAALAAHGGDKLRQMKSYIVRGAAEVQGSPTYVIPATFEIVIAGDRYSFEVKNPMFPFKQTYDGKQTASSGYELPPITSLGFPMLAKIGDATYPISALGAKIKKKGFRITTPDGFYTDFFVDEKTGRIKGYESSYDVDGRTATTSVEIDDFQTVENIVIPRKYSQRFDLGQITGYATFNTKDILINVPVTDDMFVLSK